MLAGLSLAQLLFSVLGGAEAILPDIEAALTAHWGKDHVAQAQNGLALLTDAVNRVAATVNSTPEQAAPSDQMGQAPATAAK